MPSLNRGFRWFIFVGYWFSIFLWFYDAKYGSWFRRCKNKFIMSPTCYCGQHRHRQTSKYLILPEELSWVRGHPRSLARRKGTPLLQVNFRECASLLSLSVLSKLQENAIPFPKVIILQLQITPLSLPRNPRQDLALLRKYLHQSRLIKLYNNMELWVSYNGCLTCIPVMSWVMIQNEKLDFSLWKPVLLIKLILTTTLLDYLPFDQK